MNSMERTSCPDSGATSPSSSRGSPDSRRVGGPMLRPTAQQPWRDDRQRQPRRKPRVAQDRADDPRPEPEGLLQAASRQGCVAGTLSVVGPIQEGAGQPAVGGTAGSG